MLLMKDKGRPSRSAEIDRLLMEEIRRVKAYGILVSITKDDPMPSWEYWGTTLGRVVHETSAV